MLTGKPACCYSRAMNAATDMGDIGWQGELPARPLARVVAQHRSGYEIHDGQSIQAAQPAGQFLKPGLEPEQRPAVGDFVHFQAGEPIEIDTIVPRRSMLVRAAAGERYQRQLIATNIDTVMVLTGLDGDYNPKRIERYLLLIAGSGVQAVVLLTKADASDNAAERAEELRMRLPDDTPVLAINAKSADSIMTLSPWLGPGMTVALVGSSGAGKSTLTNTLLGEARMDIGAVRTNDSRGRHTTTHRALLKLPGGACLIDTPGMRELKLTGEESLDSFADVEELARQCRFNDCAHESEPGCAVQSAIDDGRLDANRWQNYAKLNGEHRQQAASRQARLERKADAASQARRKRRGAHDWKRNQDDGE